MAYSQLWCYLDFVISGLKEYLLCGCLIGIGDEDGLLMFEGSPKALMEKVGVDSWQIELVAMRPLSVTFSRFSLS